MAWTYVCAVNIKSGRCTEGFYSSFSLCLRTKFLIASHTHNLALRRRLLLFLLNGSFVLRTPPFNLCYIAKHKRSTNLYVWNWEHKTMGNLLMYYWLKRERERATHNRHETIGKNALLAILMLLLLLLLLS